MGPVLRPPLLRGFNGATAMKPWKSIGAGRFSGGSELLQWGHGDEAVEEKTNREFFEHLPQASMGPRR